MDLSMCFLFLFMISSASAVCKPCVHQSKAILIPHMTKYYLAYGMCNYGTIAVNYYRGNLAGVPLALYNDGIGCGECFEIRCKNSVHCSVKGVQVVTTSHQSYETTGFELTRRAFKEMAKKGKANELAKLGKVDIEYTRIPCEYKKHNLSIIISAFAEPPNYLAIIPVYQGGLTQIASVEVRQVHASKWMPMERVGALWRRLDHVPAGPFSVKFKVDEYDNTTSLTLQAENIIPADWQVDGLYDTGINLSEIKPKSCPQCGSE